ncbi:MAG: rhomboid family intramembrane serine protease [Prevotellaceae bacterium]|jgi:membrane associated rhomboid family serine protease|nr:rhomboid family intramembrane serine protease [Prevotellaceae bacterium]
MNGYFNTTPPVVKNLIIVNALMYLAMLFGESFMIGNFALYYPGSPNFKVLQLLTHMFMHGDFFHLFFNMYALWLFGSIIERVWGGKKFLTYYFITGFGAVGLHLLLQWLNVKYITDVEFANISEIARKLAQIYHTPTLGASGAVYGVLLAFGMMYPNVELQLIFPPIRLKALRLVIIFGAIELIVGLLHANDGIAHFAHLGGMLFGYVSVMYWKRRGTLFRNDDYY